MKYYVISDTHFGHKKMLEIGRPENYEQLIKQSLESLSENDVLIHLGDVCMGNDAKNHEEFIAPLRCRKILVKGNHDNKSLNWYMEHGWDFACNMYRMEYGGHIIDFTHIPVEAPERFLNIHGHLHNISHRAIPPFYSERNRLVSLEIDGYQAFPLEKYL